MFAEVKENTNTVSQQISEDIYADYDSFESDDSWDDCRSSEKLKTVPYPCENRDLPALPNQQNIYGLVPLVKRAGNRMKKRWSLASLGLNRIRKIGVGNLTDLGNKTYDSRSDNSNDKIFSSSTKYNSLSSIFYLNDPIYNNMLVLKFKIICYITHLLGLIRITINEKYIHLQRKRSNTFAR